MPVNETGALNTPLTLATFVSRDKLHIHRKGLTSTEALDLSTCTTYTPRVCMYNP